MHPTSCLSDKRGERAGPVRGKWLQPGMRGAELARDVNVLKLGPPVLIVSGYAEVDVLPEPIPPIN